MWIALCIQFLFGSGNHKLASINLSCCYSHWWRWCSKSTSHEPFLFLGYWGFFHTRMHFRRYSHASLRASATLMLYTWHCEIATGRRSRVRNFRAAGSKLLQLLRPCEKKGVKIKPNDHNHQSSEHVEICEACTGLCLLGLCWLEPIWSLQPVGLQLSVVASFWKTSMYQEPMPIDGRDSSRWGLFFFKSGVVGFPQQKKTILDGILWGSENFWDR